MASDVADQGSTTSRPSPAARRFPRVSSDDMGVDGLLSVREMRLPEMDLRIDYFHDAADSYLHLLGVDRDRLPSREEWRQFYEEDQARPMHERRAYSLIWEVDGTVVGFSSTDRIDFGHQAFMHLHIVDPARRSEGLGAKFVRASAEMYFRNLELEQLFCEPNAFNVAPNRTLQRAGFTYLFTHEVQPGPINFWQATTRWVLERPDGRPGRHPDSGHRWIGTAGHLEAPRPGSVLS